MATQQRNQELVSNLTPDFVRHDNIQYQYGDLISRFQALPGLVGLWYPGNVQRSTGNIYDSSGQNRTLTYNGNPTINYLPNGVAYADLDGAGDFWSRADETDLDILGTEAWAANPGLTVGGWVYGNNYIATNQYLLSKMGASGQYSWRLLLGRTGIGNTANFLVSAGGSGELGVSSGATTWIPATWQFLVGRFVPSTAVSVCLNGTWFNTVAGVPASIFNSTAALTIGGDSLGAQLLAGRVGIGFLCANALNDALINGLFQQTRSLYGV